MHRNRLRRLQLSFLLLLAGMGMPLVGGEPLVHAASTEAEAPSSESGKESEKSDPVDKDETPSTKDASDDSDDDKLGTLDGERFKVSTREIPFEGGDGKVVVWVSIKGAIDLGIAPFLERVLADAGEREDVVAVVSEINTPGGRVDAASQIKDAYLNSKVPTIAWVHTQAISAGALIAYAHDFIFFSTGGTMGAATPIQLAPGGEAQPVGEKVVSYMRGLIRATAEAKGRDGDVAEAMVDASLHVSGVSRKGKLLTLTDKQALRIGVGDGQADSMDALFEALRLTGATVEEPQINWAEEIARVLTGPTLSSLLMALGMLGIFFELSSPGFGFPGILGITSLLLFFLGHHVVHLAGAEEVALMGVGLLLIGAEIFVIPGLGIAGVLGIVCVFISLVLMLIAVPLDVSWEIGDLSSAIERVAIAMMLTLAGSMALFKLLPGTRMGRRLVLATAVGDVEEGAFEDPAWRPEVGDRGRVERDLRPVGKARIDGHLVDVVSQGDYLEVDSEIEVVAVEGGRVLVQPSKGGEGP